MRAKLFIVLLGGLLVAGLAGCPGEEESAENGEGAEISRDDIIAAIAKTGHKEKALTLGPVFEEMNLLLYDEKYDEYKKRIDAASLENWSETAKRMQAALEKFVEVYEPSLGDPDVSEADKALIKEGVVDCKVTLAILKTIKNDKDKFIMWCLEDLREVLVDEIYNDMKDGKFVILSETIEADGGKGYYVIQTEDEGEITKEEEHYVKDGDVWKINFIKILENDIKLIEDIVNGTE